MASHFPRLMHYVYIIRSEKFTKEIYIGSTQNIPERLQAHNAGKSTHTNKFKPWELIYYCAFTNRNKAFAFEKYLKTSSGITFRNKRLI